MIDKQRWLMWNKLILSEESKKVTSSGLDYLDNFVPPLAYSWIIEFISDILEQKNHASCQSRFVIVANFYFQFLFNHWKYISHFHDHSLPFVVNIIAKMVTEKLFILSQWRILMDKNKVFIDAHVLLIQYQFAFEYF